MDPLILFKALAEPTRLKTLLLIEKKGELCVCDLIDALNLSQPKISRHLAELRKQQIVIDERRGKWVYYKINPAMDQLLRKVLQLTLKQRQSYIDTELRLIQPEQCDN